jgi:ATP adenylyltransferase
VRAEQTWRKALQVSDAALAAGALIPLQTRLLDLEGLAPFQLRQLLSRPPRHLRSEGPKVNPFLPWDRPLEVERLPSGHVVILNKYPVQKAHLLLITEDWQPQGGWLRPRDWQAVARLGADTGGLWFFNSCARAGASQPHRHLQLLPRHAGEASCPLASCFTGQLEEKTEGWPWAYRLSRRRDPRGGTDLPVLYADHCRSLGIGDPGDGHAPRGAYNLLFDDDWFLSVLRVQEHCAGFSVNALGFAGFLLCTDSSDQTWLSREGPWELLREVAAPGR